MILFVIGNLDVLFLIGKETKKIVSREESVTPQW